MAIQFVCDGDDCYSDGPDVDFWECCDNMMLCEECHRLAHEEEST